MENYFNYFTEIEEHFQRRWGGILRLSPLDWVLMETWRDAGIPLVEIFCARQHFDYRDKAQIGELKHWFHDSRLKVHSLHSPMFSDDVWGRTGPDAVMNGGIVFLAPCAVALCTCGLVGGLDPPTDGCA